MRPHLLAFLSPLAAAACTNAGEALEGNGSSAPQAGPEAAEARPFAVEPIGQFSEPWAMTFLPNGTLLVTQRGGALKLRTEDGRVLDVAGVPPVDAGGQGGLGDVILHPDYLRNGLIYLSWVEAGEGGTRGAAVGRARFVRTEDGAGISNLQVIWRQTPKVTGRGHFGHRLAFGRDGHLFITNGDRQKFEPAQDMRQDLGKILRLNDDGSTPRDNPFYNERADSTARPGIWSLGHRNPLGIAFDRQGRLWAHEMGPQGGDELNLIERGANYGYPIVSNGSHYGGRDIPDHPTRPEFRAPKLWWNPSISPAGLIIYSGRLFPEWRGDALMGALSGQSLVRIDLDGANAREANRWPMGARIREVEEGPDGAIYLLEDESGGSGGRLLRLTPAGQARR
ncbi:PQQ-dependent sugar dehydrogenase [Allosphingosinicella sp.]|jgi:glucose/arabinose dehydrogenase|uniref:PQQ-dependent sugar dehydrogenase n=1 Tax=Allosphingosinicella sp. TaxID=2823234 RepID=UPI002EE29808